MRKRKRKRKALNPSWHAHLYAQSTRLKNQQKAAHSQHIVVRIFVAVCIERVAVGIQSKHSIRGHSTRRRVDGERNYNSKAL